jgi:beta-galactosidase
VGYTELEAMKAERALMSEIKSAPSEAKIAILLDYDALWAVRLQPHNRDFDYMRLLFVYYRASQRLGLPVDIVSADADLSSYKLVIVPTAYLATEHLAHSLKDFAETGGTVLLGVRSGFKTSSNRVTDLPLPGFFSDLVGITVSDWHSLPPGISYEFNSMIPGLTGPATTWTEALNPAESKSKSGDADLQVLSHYTTGPFSSYAALVENKVGVGKALYLGWYPTEKQAETLLAYLAFQSDVHPLATVPEGLIVSRRGNYLILLNFTEDPLMADVEGRSVLVNPRDVEVVKSHE